MKKCKVGAVVVLAGLLAAGSASALTYNLGALINGNVTVQQGDKLFADWGFGTSGGSSLTAAGVTVTTIQSGNDYALEFEGTFNANLGAANDYKLFYSVATANGAPSISAIDQSFNLTAGGNGGIIGIGETVFAGGFFNGNPVAQSSVSFISGVDFAKQDFSDPPGETLQGDQLAVDPHQSKVWVTKDMELLSAPGGIVGVTILHQSFRQDVPDGGATLSLLGLALAGVAMVRRLIG